MSLSLCSFGKRRFLPLQLVWAAYRGTDYKWAITIRSPATTTTTTATSPTTGSETIHWTWNWKLISWRATRSKKFQNKTIFKLLLSFLSSFFSEMLKKLKLMKMKCVEIWILLLLATSNQVKHDIWNHVCSFSWRWQLCWDFTRKYRWYKVCVGRILFFITEWFSSWFFFSDKRCILTIKFINTKTVSFSSFSRRK